METGTAIFTDLDKKIYSIKPIIIQKMAVLVPDVNIAHVQATPAMRKKILSFFILDVILMM